MAAKNAALRRQAARAGAAARWADPVTAENARRDLAAARLAEFVKRVVDAAPPLTPAQRSRIAALLAPVGTSHAEGDPR